MVERPPVLKKLSIASDVAGPILRAWDFLHLNSQVRALHRCAMCTHSCMCVHGCSIGWAGRSFAEGGPAAQNTYHMHTKIGIFFLGEIILVQRAAGTGVFVSVALCACMYEEFSCVRRRTQKKKKTCMKVKVVQHVIDVFQRSGNVQEAGDVFFSFFPREVVWYDVA